MVDIPVEPATATGSVVVGMDGDGTMREAEQRESTTERNAAAWKDDFIAYKSCQETIETA